MSIVINSPNSGVLSPHSFTTNKESISISGAVPAGTALVQVSINSSGWTSYGMVYYDDPNFVIPDPSYLQSGIPLQSGLNTLEIRTTDGLGKVKFSTTLNIHRVNPSNLGVILSPPTGFKIRRHRDSVDLLVSKSPESGVIGYNFYASTDTKGKYLKLNKDLVTEVSFQESVETELDTVSSVITSTESVSVKVGPSNSNGDISENIIDSTLDVTNVDGSIKATLTLVSVLTTDVFLFNHNRLTTVSNGTLNSDILSLVPPGNPLFYVCTSVAWDSATHQYIESPLSYELSGIPIAISSNYSQISVDQFDGIVKSIITNIMQKQPDVSLIPGSVNRTVLIDPFASEFERIHFLADFTHRSKSFSTLLGIDDTDGDGVSDPVSLNAYKIGLKAALKLETDSDVQRIIDLSFESLASNYNVTRQGPKFAKGNVRAWTTARPVSLNSLTVRPGSKVYSESSVESSATVEYTVVGGFTATGEVDDYYDPSSGVWQTGSIQIIARVSGKVGNKPPNRVNKPGYGFGSLRVTNDLAIAYGEENENNLSLAERSLLGLAVDSGTKNGYEQTARISGVTDVEVVDAQHPSMFRDWDPIREKHVGGKVDVWVCGEELDVVTETFAFNFGEGRKVLATFVGESQDLLFTLNDSRLTQNSPIKQVIDDVDRGLGAYNVTTGKRFVLTGVLTYPDVLYNQIKLNPDALNQIDYNPDDVVRIDYAFQLNSAYVLKTQPARSVVTLVGDVSGLLVEGTHFDFIADADPRTIGRSSGSNDRVQINRILSGNTWMPSGDPLLVAKENHTLLGVIPLRLDQFGINPSSVAVYEDAGGEVEYTLGEDYTITSAVSVSDYTTITRVASGSIPDGGVVYVDYAHDENFTVTYVTNRIIDRINAATNLKKHATADVIIKENLSAWVDVEATVVLVPKFDPVQADINIRTALGRLQESKRPGVSLDQSDVITAIGSAIGVDKVVVPLARLTRADGTLVVAELVHSKTDSTGFVHLVEESTYNTSVYLFTSPLQYPTSDHGGNWITQPVGVFKETQPMTTHGIDSATEISGTVNGAFIIGSDGASLAGYSDDATLTLAGFSTDADRQIERKLRTANRVLVAIPTNEIPTDYMFEATYSVYGSTGARDIGVSSIERAMFSLIRMACVNEQTS